jgi:AraC-like DNA-binding protein
MQETNRSMDNSTIVKSTIFRTPLSFERRLGLWVDRIGKTRNSAAAGASVAASADPAIIPAYRRLGLFGAVMIDEGAGVFESLRGGKRQVGPGDLLLLFPTEPHRYYPDGSWVQRWIVWGGPSADALVDMDDSTLQNPIVRACVHPFAACFLALNRLMGKEDKPGALGRASALMEFCAALAASRSEGGGVRDAGSSVAESLEYARLHCASALSSGDLAARAGLSETHYRRLFQKLTGNSPGEFLAACRTALAKALLADGLSVKETAYRVGYGDPAYFSRVFARYAGMSPRAFAESSVLEGTRRSALGV